MPSSMRVRNPPWRRRTQGTVATATTGVRHSAGCAIGRPSTVPSGDGWRAYSGGASPRRSAARRAKPGRGADDQETGAAVAQVGERMGHAARGERQPAGSDANELVAQLERELALENVKRLVEVVPVERRPDRAR